MIPINDSKEFSRLIDGLSTDIIDASIHYRLWKDLHAKNIEHPKVMAQSQTFWGLTLKAHLSEALHHLTRAYDQEKCSLHLTSWLLTIRDNIYIFDIDNFKERLKENPFVESLSEQSRRPDLEILTEDIRLCSLSDELVKKLSAIRGASIAHRSAKLAVKGIHISEKSPLTHDEVEILIDRAVGILNRYSKLFGAATYSNLVIGHDDYKYIFKSVINDLKSH